MEPSNELITARKSKLNSQITGKCILNENLRLINRESLLDALQALYDECSIETLQKYDKQIAVFVDKFKGTMLELKKIRINIADFEIKDIIGRGHFGEVHVVKEKQTGDVYAMKTLRKSESVEKTSFDTERDIMAFSNSPWLTSLQYSFQDSYYLYFVMEFHPGGDLLGLLYRQGGSLPESAATFYIAELILALEDLHSMGYVHRDLKPDNVLLDRCGHLKLVDFGSAAKLNGKGLVTKGPPVGTPDYVAPEVLQSVDDKKNQGYGISCDYWSLGVLAYELTVGKSPFSAQSTTTTYSRIMNHSNSLKFPQDVLLTQAYISFVKNLVTDEKSRLKNTQIKRHPLFKSIHFDSLRDQVPPFVPKITSLEDTSNFTDIVAKKSVPSIDNFKRKTQFSGRNLPFVGFTYVHDFSEKEKKFVDRSSSAKDETIKSLKTELEEVKRDLMKGEDFKMEKLNLERKLIEKEQKLENLQNVRNKLERELATSIAESTALKRTLEIERKDRAELERKALDLIKSAKTKWETAEKAKIDSLKLEIEQQNAKITQLTATNKLLDEQLQCAFKIEDKQRESFEVVEKLNRRSVLGLESRLERVSTEMKDTITDLQGNLSDANHEKSVLERKLEMSKDSEKRLLDELNSAKKSYVSLRENVEDAEKIIRQLSSKVSELEEEMQKSEDLKLEIEELKRKIDDLQITNRDLEKRNVLLESSSKTLEKDLKREIDDLKKYKTQVVELESKLRSEKEKMVSLSKELEERASEKNAKNTEDEELKEMRMKLWRNEKDLGNCKIDKRILERELKDARNEIKSLQEEIKSLNLTIVDMRKSKEKALLELSNINETLSLELMKTKESYKSLKEILDNEKEKCDNEKTVIGELKEVIHSKDLKIAEIMREIDSVRDEKLKLLHRIEMGENEKNNFISEVGRLKKEKQQIADELENVQRLMRNTQLNWEALKEACMLLENQVIEYEKLNSVIEKEKISLNENTEKLISDLCKAKSEIQEAKKLANEEKSLRLMSESKIQRLNEDIECLQNECSSYKNQCFQYKECSSSLSEELTSAEEKITDLEINVKSCERQIEDMIRENNSLKEEISRVLTQFGASRETNFKLKQEINDLKSSLEIYMRKCEELETDLVSKTMFYDERELKSESTIKQQTKLIDYLQVKIDELGNKKRTLTDKLFGSSKKENQAPVVISMNYKELEEQLQKQKTANRHLQEEIYRLKAQLSCKDNVDIANATKVQRHKSEILSPKSKLALEQLTKSPSMGKSHLYRQNSGQRMSHNIPHRFDAKLSTKVSKCGQCQSQINLGANVSVCLECNITVHSHCSSFVKATCGLPSGYVKHLRDNLASPVAQENKELSESNHVEGWIKLLEKGDSWVKCYASLSDSHLKIYSNNLKENAVLKASFNLGDPNKKVKIVLEPLVSEIGVNVASSDLPFVIKIDILQETTCWPSTGVIFMTLSMNERDKWFKALQRFVQEDCGTYSIETACHNLPPDLHPNCIIDLTKNIKILGCDQGLFSYYNEFLLQISDLPKITKIAIVPNTNMVIMIASTNNKLISCDLNHLINLTQCAPCTNPTLKYKNLNISNGLDGFHFLQESNIGKHQMFCAANSRQLVIVKYNLDNNDFETLRVMDTQEPLGCAIFTQHTLIVGADKFFEIDLSNFKAEEFLDSSDLMLSHAVKSYKRKSFPVAIEQIFEDPKEFLVGFNEFAVLVDEYGRSSKKFDIKPNYLPIDYCFVKPYLYMINMSGVEILKLSSSNQNLNDSNPDCLDSTVVDLKNNFRFLGKGRRGVYIWQEGKVKILEGKRLVDSDEISLTSQSTEVNDDASSDRFSFTSSIVQSLDGNLSDVESVDDMNLNGKKVTFSQTNL